MAANTFPTTKAALIANVAQRELEFQAKLLQSVRNVSSFAVPGSKSISFPKLTSFIVEDRAFGAAAPSDQVLTDTEDTILLNKNKIVKWIIDAKDDVQTSLNNTTETVKRAASALSRQVDTDIQAVLEAAGQVEATAVGAITRDIILEMRETLLNAEAIESQMTLIVGNDQEKELLKIAEFNNQDIYGPNNMVRLGQIGSLYGMPVIRRSNLGAATYYMLDSDGVGFGWQAAVAMDSQKDVDYGSGSMKHVMDMLYGTAGLQLGEGPTAGPTESELIVKDAN